MNFGARHLAFAIAAIASLASCGSGRTGSNAPALPDQPMARARAEVPLIFADDAYSTPPSFCAYANSGQNQSALWCAGEPRLKEPAGMWVDGAGNLYVADQTGFVFEYDTPSAAYPPTTPSHAYVDSLAPYGPQHAVAVTVCGDYVYAANAASEQGTNYATFTVWRLGNATPLGILTREGYGEETAGTGVACERAGNLIFAWSLPFTYADRGRSEAFAGFDEWTQQNGNTLPLFVQLLVPQPDYTLGLAINRRGSLVATSALYRRRGSVIEGAVEFYSALKANPYHVCDAPKLTPSLEYPVAVAYEEDETHLWIADYAERTLYQIDPRTCAVTNTIVKGFNGGPFALLAGVALRPSQTP